MPGGEKEKEIIHIVEQPTSLQSGRDHRGCLPKARGTLAVFTPWQIGSASRVKPGTDKLTRQQPDTRHILVYLTTFITLEAMLQPRPDRRRATIFKSPTRTTHQAPIQCATVVVVLVNL